MISVIICTYNRASFLPKALSSLCDTTCSDYEVIVVDNNSTDDTALTVKSIADSNPHIRYIFEPNQGLSNARNRGIEEARGDIFLFLDDDAFVEKDYLSALEGYIADYPEAGVYGGRILPYFDGCSKPKWLSRWSMGWLSALDLGVKVKPFAKGKYPFGGNNAIKRSVIEQCGGFNPSLGRNGTTMSGGEEKDLFNRVRKAGIAIIYCPKMLLHHIIRESRTTMAFVDRYAQGIGEGERVRSISNGSYPQRLIQEAVKWCATLVLLLWYCVTLRPSCGTALVRFRAGVTRSLLRKAE